MGKATHASPREYRSLPRGQGGVSPPLGGQSDGAAGVPVAHYLQMWLWDKKTTQNPSTPEPDGTRPFRLSSLGLIHLASRLFSRLFLNCVHRAKPYPCPVPAHTPPFPQDTGKATSCPGFPLQMDPLSAPRGLCVCIPSKFLEGRDPVPHSPWHSTFSWIFKGPVKCMRLLSEASSRRQRGRWALVWRGILKGRVSTACWGVRGVSRAQALNISAPAYPYCLGPSQMLRPPLSTSPLKTSSLWQDCCGLRDVS